MKSIEDLKKIRENMRQQMGVRKEDESRDTRVIVGMATCGIAAGARPVMTALMEEVRNLSLQDVIVTQTGCIGMCVLEPIVEIAVPGKEKVTYVKMTPEKAKRVVSEHLVNGRIVDEYTIGAAK